MSKKKWSESIEYGYTELFQTAVKELYEDGIKEAMSNLDDNELEMCWQFWMNGDISTWFLFDTEKVRRSECFHYNTDWDNVKFENNLFRKLPLGECKE